MRTDRPAILWLYAGTMLASATLLFLVQPMIGKLLLPALGGSPAVWNTCMVFFQLVLLLGYFYAHVVTTKLAPRQQAIVHGVMLVGAFVMLPFGAVVGAPPAEALPIGWLLGTLAALIGLPFLVLSTSAPLLQAWFARTDHKLAANPYPLYSASNLGSMMSLFSYPFLVEPVLGAQQQTQVWSIVYLGFGALLLICASVVWRIAPKAEAPAQAAEAADASPASSKPTWRDMLSWTVLAAIPSSLTLGVTTHLSTDISALPLLWILPLALYLLSFIIVFADRQVIALHTWRSMMLFAGLVLALTFGLGTDASVPMAIGLHLGVFFIITMVFHGGLVARKPAAAHLTTFYLFMSVGGALGGTLNALVAPLIFNDAYDYPLMILLSFALLLVFRREDRTAVDKWLDTYADDEDFSPIGWIKRTVLANQADVGKGAVMIALAASLITRLWWLISVEDKLNPTWDGAIVVWLGCVSVGILIFHLRKIMTVMVIIVLFFYTYDEFFKKRDDELYSARSFFGAHQVYEVPDDKVIKLAHGTTLHGAQSVDPAHRDEPLTYYTREGPIGQVFKKRNAAGAIKRVAAIGLGSGSLATYAREGQAFDFYEIDPVVSDIAHNTKYFTYLQRCGDRCKVILGDGRLTLSRAPDASYDLIILDAYSSDAIPVHLITREALALYVQKLKPDGILAFHISNRYFNLRPVLSKLSQELGLHHASLLHFPKKTKEPGFEKYFTVSRWVFLSPDKAVTDGLLSGEGWKPLEPPPASQSVWTDNYSNLFEVIK